MQWRMSYRTDPLARPIADRHYNRQSVGSPNFAPPGTCLCMIAPAEGDPKALWVTSWPLANFVLHEWRGAWMNTTFRNEGAGLSSALILDAVAATRAYYGEPPPLGMVTFVDVDKVRRKRDPGRCYLKAGFKKAGYSKSGKLALQLLPKDMPPAAPPIGFVPPVRRKRKMNDDQLPLVPDLGIMTPLPAPVPEIEPVPKVIDATQPFPFEKLSGAVFSEDRQHRYFLWRKVRETGGKLLMIGLNPSTANEDEDDNTVRREIGFCKDWGYGTLLKANIFAFKSTDPEQMKLALDPVGPDNNRWIVALRQRAQLCVVCWGVHGAFNGRGREVLTMLKPYGNLYCFGWTKNHHPKHPLYIRKDAGLIEI